ncbi:hypothetical protein APR08_005604 [Nocardia amikacinitolerans]|nr:hypothetical protein [Nocardia amikacinitolerans]
MRTGLRLISYIGEPNRRYRAIQLCHIVLCRNSFHPDCAEVGDVLDGASPS